MTGPAAFADPSALRNCWHPVAFGAGLTGQPAHADLWSHSGRTGSRSTWPPSCT